MYNLFSVRYCFLSKTTMIWLIVLTILSVLFFYKVVKPLSYWKDRGVTHKKPWPLLGNFSAIAFQQKPIFYQVLDWYNQFSNERYFGIHQFTLPILYIRDIDLIKRITVKDFDQFIDHNNIISEDVEPLMGKNLFNLKGQRWRDMRATLSPSFTSSKMKMMFTLISECAEQFTKYFEKQNEGLLEVEVKDVFTRFTNDAIATVAFGLKCNSLEDKNNAFYMMGKTVTTFRGLTLLAINLYSMFPKLSKFLQLRILSKSVVKFFTGIIKETLNKREKEGLVRPDMIHLLMEARKEQMSNDTKKSNYKLVLTDEDITAQALIFIFGGFETSATLMCFVAYELALNKDIQMQLQNEIDETLNECNGILTYEALHKMKYLDMVVSETLRKWPPGFLLDRLCVKDYVVEPANSSEKQLVIEKGDLIQIPFPNPDTFDPERFNDENKHNIEPFSYLPFGSGPRNCIASRFALMENKTLIFHLLSKFDIVRIDKTPYPMKIAANAFNIVPVGGFWLGFKLRENKQLT
ncbi:hypothetical protein RN001_013368 [Aquatica leii]|uniref:Cytochrome P450 n=1 Tax=Aquatica leii TaxID=1421715 RepID=A0AAN7QD44_9COLE|nr:hypothetical protein RN001_013368 [Aquatica leii]